MTACVSNILTTSAEVRNDKLSDRSYTTTLLFEKKEVRELKWRVLIIKNKGS